MKATKPRRQPSPLDAYLELRTLWRDSPLLYVRQRFAVEPSAQQRQILDAILPPGAKVSVRSGHFTGKSSSAAFIIYWFLETHDFAKIPCTAPTAHQLADVLWGELRKWQRAADDASARRGDPPYLWLSNLFTLKMDSLYDPGARDWAALARTARPENPDALQGFHAEHLLFIVDEASGVHESIFEVAEGAISGKNNRLLMLGQGTRTSGTFYQSHHKDRGSYTTIHLRSQDSTLPTADPDYRARLVRKWGENSNVVRVRADGEFPKQEDDILISLELTEPCTTRERVAGVGPRKLGVDVARFGCFDDETEILTNEGWKHFADLTGAEYVLTLNGEVAEWGPITQLHQYAFDGELNYYESKRINFAITDNHKLLVRKDRDRSTSYVLRRFDELPGDFVIRRCNTWGGCSPDTIEFTTQVLMPHGGYRIHTHKFSMIDWALFLGWFVSEGNVYQEKRENGRNRIVLAQYRGAKRTALEHLLTRMGITWRACANGTQIEFTSQSIGQHLIEHCGQGAASKRIPVYIKEGSTAVIEAFLDGHCLGDGTQRANGDGRAYGTTSRQLANDLQEVLAKIGRAGRMSRKNTAGSKGTIDGRTITRLSDNLVVYERLALSRRRPGQWRDSNLKKSSVQRRAYTGKVYCVSTPYQTIYVRRHGCPMWSGNSDRSTLVLRQGRVVDHIKIYAKQDTMVTVGCVVAVLDAWQVDEIDVDVIGLGAGVYDRLAELHAQGKIRARVVAVNVATDPPVQPRQGEPRPRRLRDYLWLEMARWLREEEPVFCADDREACEDLAGELSSVKYRPDSDGCIVVEDKDSMKKRLGVSPDLADGLGCTFAPATREAPIAFPGGVTQKNPWR